MKALLLASILGFLGLAPVCDPDLKPPAASLEHKREMTRSAWRIWGPDAKVAVLAAQIHQESAWDCDAVSWAGAEGCAQFMPLTAKDMAKQYPEDCAPVNPFSEKWAFNCRDRYLKRQQKSIRNDETGECDVWALSFRAYNGGLGWVRRDQRLTEENGQDRNDWHDVENWNAGRRASAFKENTEYPRRIFALEERYCSWGDKVDCL